MTNQEVFDAVARHLLTQGEVSRVEHGGNCEYRCLYRGPRGLKCAIGVLIPDERYEPRLEGLSSTSREILDACGLGVEHAILVDQLQRMHDVGNPVSWAGDLREIANWFKLNSTIVDCMEESRCVAQPVVGQSSPA